MPKITRSAGASVSGAPAPVPVPEVEQQPDYSGCTRAELAGLCRGLGLPHTGNRSDLLARLEQQ